MNSSNYKSPIKFYFLSTLLPWSFWFIAGYISRLSFEIEHQSLIISTLGFIGLITPMIVALTLIKKESNLSIDFLNRFLNFNKTTIKYLILSVCIMPLSILMAMAVSLLFSYSIEQFYISGNYTFTSGIFPVWFLLIMAPVLEELAWHSYGTDVLTNRFNLLQTSLLFALYWGIWHIPLSSIKGYYQSNLVVEGWIHSVNFLVSIFPFVIIMNWLYYKSNRNILVAIFIHIGAGFFNEIFATNPDSKIIQTALLLVFSIIIVFKEKKMFLGVKNTTANKVYMQ